jgi:hypothetical protein
MVLIFLSKLSPVLHLVELVLIPSTGVMNYLVDAYLLYAASVLAANTVLRSVNLMSRLVRC